MVRICPRRGLFILRYVFILISLGALLTLTVFELSSDVATTGKSIATTFRPPERLDRSWIVITSVAPPTADVMYMAALPGWRVVMVGDVRTPANWSYPNCVYLSVADQEALGLRLSSKLPIRSYSRKSIGYLYAILHGATVIYDTDDDNRPLDNLTSFQTKPSTSGLVADYQASQVFNPYPHFGQPTLWPRGFPLATINGQMFNRTYRLSTTLDTPLIQQGIVKGDPDFDAIFRLTRKGTTSVFNVTYDPVTPPVFLPAGMYSPINSQNTMFLYNAFWALLLPTTTSFRVCDIWRGYWAQRLLWEIGGSLGFPAANARQSRNPHSYLKDALDETQMYFHTDRLLDFLSSWSCPQEFSFFACVEQLSFDMAEEGFWGKEDAEITRIWLRDLHRIGYREPRRARSTPYLYQSLRSRSSLSSSNNCDEAHVAITDNNTETSFVSFIPVDQEAPSLDSPKESIPPYSTRYLNHVVSICPDLLLNGIIYSKQSHQVNDLFRDVLLIIIFHFPYYNNLRYTEATYRPTFLNIAYCGPEAHTFQSFSKNLGRNLTFIEADLDGGVIGYICLIKAISAGFHVNGYLVIGDDVMLNFWSLNGFNKTQIWTAKNNLWPMKTHGNNTENWLWRDSIYGIGAWSKANSELSKTPVPAGISSPSDFKKILLDNTKKLDIKTESDTLVHAMADIYFVPARLAPSARWYLTLFLKHRLFLEIAVPLVLYGLQSIEEMQHLEGRWIWGADRYQAWKFFNPLHHYLHPVKFSNPKDQDGYCSNYAPLFLKHALGISLADRPIFNKTDTSRTVL